MSNPATGVHEVPTSVVSSRPMNRKDQQRRRGSRVKTPCGTQEPVESPFAGRRPEEDRDRVTGLLALKGLGHVLDGRLGTAQRDHQELACILIQVKEIAKIMEIYGREIGNEALRSVANVLRSAVGSGGTVGRYSPDTFLVLQDPSRATAEPREFSQKIVAECRSNMLNVRVGVAYYPRHGGSRYRLLEEARRSLARAHREEIGRVRARIC